MIRTLKAGYYYALEDIDTGALEAYAHITADVHGSILYIKETDAGFQNEWQKYDYPFSIGEERYKEITKTEFEKFLFLEAL